MNKKIMVFSILAVFILVAISFTSVVGFNNEKTNDKKESPLYKIRTGKFIGKRLWDIIDFIKTRFLGGRIFWIPFQLVRNLYKSSPLSPSGEYTCYTSGCATICGWKCRTWSPNDPKCSL